MTFASILVFVAAVMPVLASASDYNLGELTTADKIDVFNRTIGQKNTDSPEVVFLDAAPDDGLAWIAGVELSEGTIELEIKGKKEPGRSFVGIAFHGQDNRVFDAVYLRPFNFQAAEQNRRSHSIQYISMPEHNWSQLREAHPGEYEFEITPAPEPDSWIKVKLVIQGKNVAAFVNDSERPALQVELLNDRRKGKVGLWVGNGSDGWFRKLKVDPRAKMPLGADTDVPDLKQVAMGIGAEIPDKSIARWQTNVKGSDALFLQGEIWLEGVNFTDGTIECDILGKSRPRGSNFPGFNFRGADGSTFDSVYFRPFNFRAENPESASHAVQYISLPEWPWQKLRAERTGQYEKPIAPPPDGDAWFHAKIVVEGNKVSVFVNDSQKACLELETLSDRRAGRVGIGAGGDGAHFANLKITPKVRVDSKPTTD